LSLYSLCGLSAPLRFLSGHSFHVGSSSPLAPITSVLYSYYYYAKCAIWSGARALSAISARLRMTPFFFSHLPSLLSLPLSLPPLVAFLRLCARECASHATKSPRGPPRAHGPTVFDSLHAHAAPSVRTAPRRWYGALVTCLPFHAAHKRI